jgi:hypothetical protein
MRRALIGATLLLALVALGAGPGSGSAAAGQKKLVEGTVYDTTCAAVCIPECPPPPHCGPITASGQKANVICAQSGAARPQVVCPLYAGQSRLPYTVICLPGPSCGGVYPLYSGEGAVVTVRKRGSSQLMAKLPVVAGHFKARLAPGEYILRPYLPDPSCWSGDPERVSVAAGTQGPIPASLDVANGCAAQPDAAK